MPPESPSAHSLHARRPPAFSIEAASRHVQARGRLKILFVCGCLEGGMDGVGDYTSLLARALILRGHSCAIVALADPHVSEIVRTEISTPASAGAYSMLRLPAAAAWAQRVAEAKRFREGFAPDWVSFSIGPLCL